MGFKQTWNKFFNNHSESTENHWDPNLRTRYFKTTKDKGFDSILEHFNRRKDCEVKANSIEHGEISLMYKGKRKAFVVVTVIMVKPFRTAVDFSVTTEGSLFDLGFSHNTIPKLFKSLEQDLTPIDRPNE
ncbi:hypothetical protein SAMN05421734_10381 [Pelagirhabdus alkalitolerans]|uniref:Cytosolic protein n=1 Tax=Pelagirhabdus alkalitolerans TaxID=1612202 RepID=A0A1G6HKG5_9BACI|nr:cytosolic protein [Pelagirhabdus alkalitolerans]SDB94750.1 hypothetical protein SAMN05421734_10381 [Pelagirhabdus alkalitolerans]